ncbi:MAG: CBS domain-containing protein [Candidatus Saccharibacteria bacterium]
MFTFLVLLLVVIFLVLALIEAVRPVHSEFSMFELKRRSEAGDKAAAVALRRERLLSDVTSLLRLKTSVLLVIFVVVSVATLGWLIGIIVSVVVSFEYGVFARLHLFRKCANQLYARYESHLLRFVEKFAGLMRFIRSVSPEPSLTRLSSKQELGHLVAQSSGVLSVDEKKLITNGIGFDERQVREIMTPKSVIDSIGKRELLGPLVLDDLHKKGHSRFPVIDGDIDHVVGVLHVQDLLTLDGGRRSTTVEKAMEQRVFYVHESQSLQHALAAFLKTHHQLFVVVNEFRETVGLLSLEDVVEALLGRKIIDEFDAHEDLRIVASRNPKMNNQAEGHKDV